MQRRGPGAFAYPHGGRRRDTYRDQQIMRILMALAQQIMLMERKPPATLFLAAVNIFLFLKPKGSGPISPPSVRAGCLNPSKIIMNGEWSRLLWSPLLHADELHLYYNMASLLWKGSILEPRMGTPKFAALIAELAITSSCMYILLALGAAIFGIARGPLYSCAVGFSGVLFGLKVLLNAHSSGWSDVAGFQLPTRYAAWAELIVVQFLSPNVSFLGHFCGILAGLLHVYGTSKVVQEWERRRRVRRSRNAPRRREQQQQSNGGGGGAGGARTWGRGTWG